MKMPRRWRKRILTWSLPPVPLSPVERHGTLSRVLEGVFSKRDHEFESAFLQRGVSCEPYFLSRASLVAAVRAASVEPRGPAAPASIAPTEASGVLPIQGCLTPACA